jgi:DnaJ like chaperone protein
MHHEFASTKTATAPKVRAEATSSLGRNHARRERHMSIWSRIIEGALALDSTGSLRALFDRLGAEVGNSSLANSSNEDGTKKIAFTIGVIALGAKLAKADGVVSRAEVDAFRKVFRIDADEIDNVARVFNQAKRDVAGYETYARQIARLFEPASPVLEELLGSLFIIASADGPVDDAELAFLKSVAEIFGFERTTFERVRSAHRVGRECDPYDVLGLPCGAPDDQVRTAYIKLVREHHPDRLIAEGMPAEFVEVANQQMAAINAAYERIRGIRQALP